jgi:hypothetical protein
VLAADGFDDAVLDGISAELGQRPAPVREADRRRRSIGQPAQGGALLCGDPRRRPAAVVLAQPVGPAAVEGVQPGVDGMGVQAEEAGDGGGVPTFAVQEHGLGAAQLPAVVSGLQQLTQLAQFGVVGSAGGHGAGHGSGLRGEGRPAIVPRVM